MYNRHTPDSILSPKEASSFRGHPSANENAELTTGDPEPKAVDFIPDPMKGLWRSERHTGTVKFYDKRKFWGFIHTPHSTRDLFIHGSDLAASGYEDLPKGAKVTYEIGRKGNAIRAINVKIEG